MPHTQAAALESAEIKNNAKQRFDRMSRNRLLLNFIVREAPLYLRVTYGCHRLEREEQIQACMTVLNIDPQALGG